jgi:hypothetical protein
MTSRYLALAVAGALAAAALPWSASAGWRQPVGGASPINHAGDGDAFIKHRLAAIGGVPYVTWSEFDGANYEVRLSRLNAVGTAWEEVVGGTSPINHVSDQDAIEPSVAAIGGAPYVAWSEYDGTNREVRVSRLNAAGTAWTELVGGASPINHASDRSASEPSLAAIGGVPYVAWDESDGTNTEVRVSRLNAAGTAWEEVVGGVSPINHAGDRNAFAPSLTAIGGVPHVAWYEDDGTNYEIRVSRLNAAGTAWEEVVGGVSPINHASDRDAFGASLAAIGGVPYVAWDESDGTNAEVRVGRLNAAGTAWEEVVGGASPINHAGDRNAFEPSLAAIGGVPYVAWREDDGTNAELRVSRLEPEFASQSAVANATGATLQATVHTYGLAYPIGFDYGPALGSQTTATPAPAGSDNVTISATIGGLSPSTGYAFRPFATAGVPAPRVLGAVGAFTTLAARRGGGAAPRRAFGRRTLVTLSLAVGRIPAKGPVAVRVSNANGFQVTGKLSGRATSKPSRSRTLRIKLGARSFRIAARADKTVTLRLPKAARRLLRRERTLSLRLTAHVTDPAGHTRTVSKTVQPKLLRQRVATRRAQQR